MVTGRCELERIIDGQPKGAMRCVAIEASLGNSKRPDLRQSLTLPVEAVATLVAMISKVDVLGTVVTDVRIVTIVTGGVTFLDLI